VSLARIPRQRTGTRTSLVLVAVGTDVHAFDRLMSWLERWRTDTSGCASRARLVVQHGRSRQPDVSGARPFLGHEELQRAMAAATLVVCHGGPATITEARRNGHLPVVVPRDPTLHEHVDNHQQLFARRLGAAGLIHLCESEDDFVGALNRGIADPSEFALASDVDALSHRNAAVARIGEVIEGLVAQRRRRVPWLMGGLRR
jgi:UDP-N-acetylglucosamine transferase subunit ALG13